MAADKYLFHDYECESRSESVVLGQPILFPDLYRISLYICAKLTIVTTERHLETEVRKMAYSIIEFAQTGFVVYAHAMNVISLYLRQPIHLRRQV